MLPENRFIEVLIIGALALIVIGPKDLPILMRRLGQFVGKMRAMAAEFRASFDELARQSELDELRREVQALRTGPMSMTGQADPHISGVFGEIEQNLSGARPPSAPAEDTASPPAAPPPQPPTSLAASPEPKAKPARKARSKAAKAPADATDPAS
jgi:sec-independent protein translocase protein TatB